MTHVEPSPRTPGNAHASGLRHPIRAVEDEAAHLHDVANRGESASTPAILAGGMLIFLVALFVVVLTIVLGVAYLATRGGGSSDTAPAFTTAGRGGGRIPPFTTLTDQQIRDVAADVTTKVAK